VYQDDGRTFAYEKGAFLRERFTCQIGGDSLRLTLGPREGSYPAWWKDVRFVIYGWTPSRGEVRVNGAAVHTEIERGEHSTAFTVADDGQPAQIEVH
jgi:alpha-glucosidase